MCWLHRPALPTAHTNVQTYEHMAVLMLRLNLHTGASSPTELPDPHPSHAIPQDVRHVGQTAPPLFQPPPRGFPRNTGLEGSSEVFQSNPSSSRRLYSMPHRADTPGHRANWSRLFSGELCRARMQLSGFLAHPPHAIQWGPSQALQKALAVWHRRCQEALWCPQPTLCLPGSILKHRPTVTCVMPSPATGGGADHS